MLRRDHVVVLSSVTMTAVIPGLWPAKTNVGSSETIKRSVGQLIENRAFFARFDKAGARFYGKLASARGRPG
jgi:hypothetical protein